MKPSEKEERGLPQFSCHFKKAAGQCSGTFLRFYYDSVHAKCKKFLWTGCIGNGNRFFSIESCNTTCAGIHGKL
uniref:BPTI/Kunitz inhibitor domain-containing protein n=1 Tax=Mola mola TaxID=94237 RepID=A0A3Q3VRJ5_MOLML